MLLFIRYNLLEKFFNKLKRFQVLTVPLVTVLILISLIPGCIQEGVSSAGYFKLSLIPEVMKIVLKSAVNGTNLSL